MMKRIIIVVIILCFSILELSAQVQLGPLEDDISTVFSAFAVDIADNVLPMNVIGDTIGEAGLGAGRHFTFGLIPLGVYADDGFGQLPDPDNNQGTWKFALPIPSLLETLLPEGDTADYYDLSNKIMAYPGLSMLQFGFPVTRGFEIFTRFFILPQSVTDWALGMVLDSEKDMEITFSIYNAQILIRKVIQQDNGWKPAISLGMSYGFSSFNLGADGFTLSELNDDSRIEITEGTGPYLDATGTFSSTVSSQTLGVDFHISKRLLLFTPFLKISPRFQHYNVNIETDLKAYLYTELTDEIASSEQEFTPSINRTASTMSIFLNPGMEINLFIPIIHISAVFDIQSPSLQFGDILDGDPTAPGDLIIRNVGVNIGLRFQF